MYKNYRSTKYNFPNNRLNNSSKKTMLLIFYTGCISYFCGYQLGKLFIINKKN